MKARELERPNKGEYQIIYDKYGIDGSELTGISADLCAVIWHLECKIDDLQYEIDDLEWNMDIIVEEAKEADKYKYKEICDLLGLSDINLKHLSMEKLVIIKDKLKEAGVIS